MKKYIVASTILLSFVTICLLLVNSQTTTEEDDNNQTSAEVKTDDNVVCNKYELDQLVVYEPHFASIGLSVSDFSSDSLEFPYVGEFHILSVAAAYTDTYGWTEFSHDLIEGNHVVEGKFYEGSPCEENTGAFIYANRHWQIVYKDFKSAIKNSEGYNDACAFEGATTVLNDIEEKIVTVKLTKIDPSKKYTIAIPATTDLYIDENEKVTIKLK